MIVFRKELAVVVLIALFVLAGCGGSKEPTPLPPTETPVPAAPAEAAAPAAAEAPKAEATASIDGKSVYNKTCSMCHAAGVAGAPKPGDKENWAPRIAQGTETMYKHSIEGYTGNSGMMPARGGNPKLTDDEMKAAVDFMVAQSK